jgi:hypothetical protein
MQQQAPRRQRRGDGDEREAPAALVLVEDAEPLLEPLAGKGEWAGEISRCEKANDFKGACSCLHIEQLPLPS